MSTVEHSAVEHSAAPTDAAAGPRGALHELTAGPYRARVCEVGATLDLLELDGRPLVLTSPADGPMLLHRGAVVAPWPNRIGDGLYTFDGQEIQAPLSEPERGNALHGLVSFQRYERLDDGTDPARLSLRTVLYPSPAYPFHLRLDVTYTLDARQGLTTLVTAHNLGTQDLPYGVCPHPYLVAGTSPLDTWTLDLTARTRLEVSPDRLLPTGTSTIAAGSELDYAGGRVIGAAQLDDAVTGLERDAGVATVRVTAPEGTGVEISFDEACPWVQVHTADRPEPENDRKGLAVEPMTCPPDAFRSGTDLVRLAPGAEHTASWTLRGIAR